MLNEWNIVHGQFMGKQICTIMEPIGKLIDSGLFFVDETAQRKRSSAKITKIQAYLSASFNSTSPGAFFAPIVVSQQPDGRLAVMDGQHRFYGLEEMLNTTKAKIKRLDNALHTSGRINISWLGIKQAGLSEVKSIIEREIENQHKILNELYSSTLPVMVFTNLSTKEEQQVFHDMNTLSTKVSKSLSKLFDHSSFETRIARHLAKESRLKDLVLYSNHTTWQTSSANKNKLMLFTTLCEMVHNIMKGMKSQDDAEILETCDLFINILLDSLPDDYLNENVYMYRESKPFIGIGKFTGELIRDFDNWANILTRVLSLVEFTWANQEFVHIGGALLNAQGQVVFNGTKSGVKSVISVISHYAESVINEINDERENSYIDAENVYSDGKNAESVLDDDSTLEEDGSENQNEQPLSGTQEAILRVLKESGGVAQLSKTRLSKKLNVSVDSLTNALIRLENKGLILIEQNVGKPNTYRLAV